MRVLAAVMLAVMSSGCGSGGDEGGGGGGTGGSGGHSGAGGNYLFEAVHEAGAATQLAHYDRSGLIVSSAVDVPTNVRRVVRDTQTDVLYATTTDALGTLDLGASEFALLHPDDPNNVMKGQRIATLDVAGRKLVTLRERDETTEVMGLTHVHDLDQGTLTTWSDAFEIPYAWALAHDPVRRVVYGLWSKETYGVDDYDGLIAYSNRGAVLKVIPFDAPIAARENAQLVSVEDKLVLALADPGTGKGEQLLVIDPETGNVSELGPSSSFVPAPEPPPALCNAVHAVATVGDTSGFRAFYSSFGPMGEAGPVATDQVPVWELLAAVEDGAGNLIGLMKQHTISAEGVDQPWDPLMAIAFDSQRQRILGVLTGRIKAWDPAAKDWLTAFDPQLSEVLAVTYVPTNDTVVAITRDNGTGELGVMSWDGEGAEKTSAPLAPAIDVQQLGTDHWTQLCSGNGKVFALVHVRELVPGSDDVIHRTMAEIDPATGAVTVF